MISIGPHMFDNVFYDVEADVLYLHQGEPSTALDFDESPEGHGLRFDGEQNLVGVTIVGVKRLVERDGKLTITVPEVVRVEAEAIAPALLTAGLGGPVPARERDRRSRKHLDSEMIELWRR